MRRSFQKNRLRLGFARVLFALIFMAVAGRAFQLQVLQGDKLKRLGERQHLKEWIVLPKRGAVLDRGSEPLALSLEAQSVYARPHRIHQPEAVARSLAKVLNLSLSEVKQKLLSDKPFVWIKRQISPVEADQIQALNVDGLGMFSRSACGAGDRICQPRFRRAGRSGASIQ
jgi:cell division protein FtsI (penicillin-binding protein 3)